MICYKDMTFCTFYKDCANATDCERKLTPEIDEAAKEFGLPLAIFSGKPQCHEQIDD
jgi:hypothetical protein